MKNTLALLLCKSQSKYISVLEQVFKHSHIDALIIDDSIVEYDTIQTNIFTNFCRLYVNGKLLKTTAWEKSFYIINKNNLVNKYDYFFFIEDDVYSKTQETIISFIKHFSLLDCDLLSRSILSIENDPTWPLWNFKDNENRKLFRNIYRSFNPFCRLSAKLVSSILEFKDNYQKFYFHEILFASLCVDNGLSYYDYKNDVESNDKYIGTVTYRPIISKQNISDHKIYHPVKDAKDNP